MRYLAAFISFLMHILVLIMIFNTTFTHFESSSYRLGIELVDPPELAENKIDVADAVYPEKNIKSKIKKNKRAQKPVKVDKSGKTVAKQQGRKKVITPEKPAPHHPKILQGRKSGQLRSLSHQR